MADSETLTVTEQLLLLAAAAHGLGPNADLNHANTTRVIDQVLRWRGLTEGEIQRGWQESGDHPVHDEVYGTLIRMTFQLPNRAQERLGVPLFVGAGNWGGPSGSGYPACAPQFNSCRLTEEGVRIARQLLVQRPEYRNKT